MKTIALFLSLIAIITFTPGPIHSQTLAKQKHWQLLDYSQDSVYGASVNRAYKELLTGKKSRPVIVAVIDEGVDIRHEDLKGHIWTNPKEIPGNGVDDDKDGYVDDVNGWNFLGNKDGRNLYTTSSEADREYARLLPLSAGMDSNQLARLARLRAQHIADSIGRNKDVYSLLAPRLRTIALQDSIIKANTGKRELWYGDLAAFQPKDSIGAAA